MLDPIWGVLTFVFGAVIGSFLNVVIWRLPRGESVVHPGSHCPHCGRALAGWENIPLFSFLFLRARCRTCHHPITWRYFWVELLTAGLFYTLYRHFGPTADTIAWCLFAAAMIAALFIDAELFIIPDELNTFALLVGIGRDVWGIVAGEPGHALLWGWLPRSIMGAMVCAAVFVLLQFFGRALFAAKGDALGDGDVKLARAVGAMLPLGLALFSFFLAVAVGAVFGIAMIAWHNLRARPAAESADEEEDESPPYTTPLDLLLTMGLLYITFLDLLLGLAARLGVPPVVRWVDRLEARLPDEEEEDFPVGPTHIPFGPYMVVGAFLAVFFGDRFIRWYLHWTGLSG